MLTFDSSQRTIDSTGAFLIGELERLDQNINLPLTSYTYSRDIQFREDVSIADDISSFTRSGFAAPGGAVPNGKNWLSKEGTALANMEIDISKVGYALNLWGMELGWTLPELQAAAQVGRPIDSQKHDGMILKWNMDCDEQVYIGDTDIKAAGLANLPVVTPMNAPVTWAVATSPDQIRASVNAILSQAWANSAYSMIPTDLLIPPTQFGILVNTIVSTAGNQSLLTYLQTNTLTYAQYGRPLNIRPVKWLIGRGVNNTDRAVAYTNDKKFVRWPMVPLQTVPVQYRGISQMVTYFGKLGAVEPVYPETLLYMDGI
jgi:hypothetical protein